MRFWKRPREDETERLLRASRAEPRDEFVISLLERLDVQQQRFRPQRLGRRALVAAAVTALAIGVGVAAGATQVAGTSISNLVHVGQSGVHTKQAPDRNSKIQKDERGASDTSSSSAADQQYTIEVCHHTNSRTHPWVDLFLSPQGAHYHLTHHPLDYLVGAPGNPTTCPP
jgi:hypothetical protein